MKSLLSSFKGAGSAGALVYQGTWNATTNTPTLANGTGEKGQFYRVNVAGTFEINGLNVWDIGDIIAYNGTTWDRIEGGMPYIPAAAPSLYTWFAYADSADGNLNFTIGAWTNQTYLGYALNKSSLVESTVPGDYTWIKIQGPQGVQGTTGSTGAAGPQGNNLYTWIAYANNSTGTSGFAIGVNTGQTYIGISNNQTSATESNNPADYTWSLIKGTDGIPGTPGANGQPTYTWFAYADNASGTVGFTTGSWTGQTYLGIAANKNTQVEGTNPAEYVWSKMQGDQGSTGPTGAAGPQGQSMYTWIAYADDINGSTNFTTGTSSGRTYIGIANNQTSAIESTNPNIYTWSKITGDAGVPGTPGVDGRPSYTWFAYANSANGVQDFTTGAWTNQSYLGLAANKLTDVESQVPSDYTWSKIQGAQGPQGDTGLTGAAGPQGNSLYTWIAYASDINGSTNFSIGANTGQTYIGIANNKTTSVESNNPADYTWSKITGTDGVPGTPGANGQPTYTWFAYADSLDGYTNFTTATAGGRTYLGIKANQLSATESNDPAVYFWTQIKGDNGANGANGVDGTRGAGQFYATGNSWADVTAINTITARYPTGPITNDTVTISNGTSFAMTKVFDGAMWTAPGTVVDGNLLVSGSVSAAKINTNGLTIRDSAGNIILDAGSNIGAIDFNAIGGSNKPANNATVGATFGTNISGQIDSSNVSTYIANAAITDACIGTLHAKKIINNTLIKTRGSYGTSYSVPNGTTTFTTVATVSIDWSHRDTGTACMVTIHFSCDLGGLALRELNIGFNGASFWDYNIGEYASAYAISIYKSTANNNARSISGTVTFHGILGNYSDPTVWEGDFFLGNSIAVYAKQASGGTVTFSDINVTVIDIIA